MTKTYSDVESLRIAVGHSLEGGVTLPQLQEIAAKLGVKKPSCGSCPPLYLEVETALKTADSEKLVDVAESVFNLKADFVPRG